MGGIVSKSMCSGDVHDVKVNHEQVELMMREDYVAVVKDLLPIEDRSQSDPPKRDIVIYKVCIPKEVSRINHANKNLHIAFYNRGFKVAFSSDLIIYLQKVVKRDAFVIPNMFPHRVHMLVLEVLVVQMQCLQILAVRVLFLFLR